MNTGEEVPTEDIMKGYKVDTDTHIKVSENIDESVGLCRREALRRLNDLDLETDGPVDGNAVLAKQKIMLGSELLRRLLGKYDHD